ncbi:MAG: hypothetical protein AB4352_22330 [Hormoscilla sp.]
MLRSCASKEKGDRPSSLGRSPFSIGLLLIMVPVAVQEPLPWAVLASSQTLGSCG